MPVILRDVARRFAFDEVDPELHSARHERDVARADFQPPEFGPKLDRALLRDDQQLAVGVDEDTAFHAALRPVEVHRAAFEILRHARAQHGDEPVDEILALRQVGRRVPAQAIGSEWRVRGRRTEERRAVISVERTMVGGRPHPVEPASAILVSWRGEGGPRQLLGVEAECGPLRAVAAPRERPFDRLAFEMAAEAAHVLQCVRLHGAPLKGAASKLKRAQSPGEPRPRRAGLASRAFE